MTKPYKWDVVCWDEKGPNQPGISLEIIDAFDARGMRRIYGRGDHYGRRTFNMDIWQARGGGLFARFWSRNYDVEWCSFEIIGFPAKRLTQKHEMCGDNEHCVPECLRREYESWVISEM